jgi:hypothetical protein
MITNTGKAIMAKYLLGQTPAYASYMAFGCGPKALKTISYTPTTKAVVSTTATLTITSTTHEIVVGDYVTVSGVGYGLDGVFQITGVTTTTISYTTAVTAFAQEAIPSTGTAFVSKNYSNKTSLDLEMFRAPIISKGYVIENGISKIVLTADLPTDERYEITEIGIFPAESNSLNGTYDSKIISSFSNSEGWKYNVSTDILNIVDTLDPNTGIIDSSFGNVFFTNSDNAAFTYPARVQKQERPRYLNNSMIVRGDASQITFGTPSTSTTGNRVSLPITLDLTKNNLSDEFRLGFSVLSKDITSANTISTAKILVEFATNNAVLATSGREYARMEISVANGTSTGQADFPNNRYVVASKKLSDLVYSNGFSWDAVQYINVYVSVDGSDGNNSANFYVALDMLRLENTSQNNPVYGLTGYTVVKNLSTDGTYAAPLVKNTNTSNFVEFRFNMDVK